MPRFSQHSFSILATCHIDLQVLFFEVIKSFDCTILEGHRNQQDQDADFAKGVTTLKWPNGKHNHVPSYAVDVAPYPVDFDHHPNRFYWFAGYVMGIAERLKAEGKITHAVRWGGDWDKDFDILDEKGLRDLVHFELII